MGIYRSRINHEKARQHFISTGEIPPDSGPHDYILHHIDPSWKTEDPERYEEWRIEDLVVMTQAEHNRLHNTGTHLSEEARKKHRESLRRAFHGAKYYNNGTICVRTHKCPAGFVPGRIWSRKPQSH